VNEIICFISMVGTCKYIGLSLPIFKIFTKVNRYNLGKQIYWQSSALYQLEAWFIDFLDKAT